VASINFDPRLDSLEILKHPAPIDRKISKYREFVHRLKNNRLLELINKSSTTLPSTPIDHHRTRPTHLLKTP
jgi:hypothetical protein